MPRDPDRTDDDALLAVLAERFERHRDRHPEIRWSAVARRLAADPGKLAVLRRMEETGGEPDVVGRDAGGGGFLFFDCAAETPAGRRGVCYDREALLSRKEHRPPTSAAELAAEIGIAILTEDQYHHLQQLGEFDTKTSSWLQTPDEVRRLGGAIFGDRRFGRVFVYHNGAQSYYAVRGFRGCLVV